MKALTLFFCSLIIFSSAYGKKFPYVSAEKTFSTSEGVINILSLEDLMSSKVGSRDINIRSMRQSYNPVKVSAAYIGQFMDGDNVEVKYYVIDFSMNGQDDIQCEFIMNPKARAASITACESETSNLKKFDGVFFYDDLRLYVENDKIEVELDSDTPSSQ